jgi:hypothetical protein
MAQGWSVLEALEVGKAACGALLTYRLLNLSAILVVGIRTSKKNVPLSYCCPGRMLYSEGRRANPEVEREWYAYTAYCL